MDRGSQAGVYERGPGGVEQLSRCGRPRWRLLSVGLASTRTAETGGGGRGGGGEERREEDRGGHLARASPAPGPLSPRPHDGRGWVERNCGVKENRGRDPRHRHPAGPDRRRRCTAPKPSPFGSRGCAARQSHHVLLGLTPNRGPISAPRMYEIIEAPYFCLLSDLTFYHGPSEIFSRARGVGSAGPGQRNRGRSKFQKIDFFRVYVGVRYINYRQNTEITNRNRDYERGEKDRDRGRNKRREQ
jgi:hypothetical protein